MKRLIVLMMVSLFFVGCGLFDTVDDIQDTVASKDLIMSNAGMSFTTVAPTDPIAAINPANWQIAVAYDLEADNRANTSAAKVGAMELDVMMDTTTAEPIHLTSTGMTIPGAAVDTIHFTTPLNYTDHKNTMIYIVNRQVANEDMLMSVGGSYDFEIANLPMTKVTIPAQDITVEAN